jgi:hypothetical protein
LAASATNHLSAIFIGALAKDEREAAVLAAAKADADAAVVTTTAATASSATAGGRLHALEV